MAAIPHRLIARSQRPPAAPTPSCSVRARRQPKANCNWRWNSRKWPATMPPLIACARNCWSASPRRAPTTWRATSIAKPPSKSGIRCDRRHGASWPVFCYRDGGKAVLMKDAAPGTLIFRRLRLENWRNFTQVDVDLQNRVFLVGPNASGKSNLLDVFRFLHEIVSVGGGFQEAAGPQRGGVTKLRSLSARRYPDIVIEVHIGSDDLPNAWRTALFPGQSAPADHQKGTCFPGRRGTVDPAGP